jgi:hypothetical protein
MLFHGAQPSILVAQPIRSTAHLGRAAVDYAVKHYGSTCLMFIFMRESCSNFWIKCHSSASDPSPPPASTGSSVLIDGDSIAGIDSA